MDFFAGFFLLMLWEKSAQRNPPGKSLAKSSKIYTPKIPDIFLQRGWANECLFLVYFYFPFLILPKLGAEFLDPSFDVPKMPMFRALVEYYWKGHIAENTTLTKVDTVVCPWRCSPSFHTKLSTTAFCKVRKVAERTPNFPKFRPELCSESCSKFSPNVLRSSRAYFSGKCRQPKLHQNITSIFNAKSSQIRLLQKLWLESMIRQGLKHFTSRS